jgi:hypothetical protein
MGMKARSAPTGETERISALFARWDRSKSPSARALRGLREFLLEGEPADFRSRDLQRAAKQWLDVDEILSAQEQSWTGEGSQRSSP